MGRFGGRDSDRAGARDLAMDDFNEADHPRDGGKFTSGGGSSKEAKPGGEKSFGGRMLRRAGSTLKGAAMGAGRGFVSPISTGLGFAPHMHKEMMTREKGEPFGENLPFRLTGHALNLAAAAHTGGGVNLLAGAVGGIGGARKGWKEAKKRGDSAIGRRGGRASDKAGDRDHGG